jgi:hypothetical protein
MVAFFVVGTAVLLAVFLSYDFICALCVSLETMGDSSGTNIAPGQSCC